MVCIKHSYHQNIHPCILLAYRITSHLSMHHSPCIAQKCTTFVVLSLHPFMPYVDIASSVCILLMHLVCCISLAPPRPSTHSRCFFTRHTSGIFIPLHISSSGFFNPQHCIPEIFISLHCHHISRDLYPTSYHGISTPLHSISLHISSKGLYPFTSCDLYPTAYLISGNLLPLHCISEISISLHCHYISRDLHPTSYHGVSIPLHCISGSLSHITHHPRVFTAFISRDLYLDACLNISIDCITILIKPNQHFIISMILLGLPRPLQVFLSIRATTPAPGFHYF